MLNSINTNIAAYSAQQNIGRASTSAGASIARLSSGERITRAADDVAAMSIGTSLQTGISTLRTALVNSSQGSSLLQVADGALQQVTDILQRQKSIAVQAGSGTLTAVERGFLNQEFQSLSQEIDRIVDSTNFNGVKLLGGGLGNSTTLVNLDATVAAADFNAADNTAVAVAGAKAIQAFNNTTGAELQGVAASGEVEIVAADGTTALTNGAFLGVNSAVIGQFDSFEITDVTYGVSGKLTATINGVEFTGTFAHNATSVVVSNGETRLGLGTSALDLTSQATLEIAKADITDDFKDTEIYRTVSIGGVDYTGTELEGSIGVAAAAGNAVLRIGEAGSVDISNFQYVSNTGAANTSTLTVEINGETFTAAGVADGITAGMQISFENGKGEALMLDFTGLDNTVTDIRTDLDDRAAFVEALNTGFSRSGGGLNFAVGSEASDTITVQIDSASTSALYGGQSLSVATAESADVASAALDVAIKNVTTIRADVGALQSRFDFASANVESSIQNQDAARGVLLDTDITAESTSFASAQVQLQAGISVLAQANLLPQNLLKLIG